MSFDWRTNIQNLLFYGYDIQTTPGVNYHFHNIIPKGIRKCD